MSSLRKGQVRDKVEEQQRKGTQTQVKDRLLSKEKTPERGGKGGDSREGRGKLVDWGTHLHYGKGMTERPMSKSLGAEEMFPKTDFRGTNNRTQEVPDYTVIAVTYNRRTSAI